MRGWVETMPAFCFAAILNECVNYKNSICKVMNRNTKEDNRIGYGYSGFVRL